MDDKDFEDLIKSVKQAGEISRGALCSVCRKTFKDGSHGPFTGHPFNTKEKK